MAAFIGEPVQGAGGVIIPPETYWPEIQRICDRYGILLVSDEVICGFGRTGQWFGCEHFGTRPDLMTMAKAHVLGLPADRRRDGGRARGAHGSSTRAASSRMASPIRRHPVCCAVALANLPDHPARAPGRACARHVRVPTSRQRWAGLAEHPLVGEARGAGPARRAGAGRQGRQSGSRRTTWFEPRGKVGERCRDNAITQRSGDAGDPRHHDHRTTAGHHPRAKSTSWSRRPGVPWTMTLTGLKSGGWL